jgi:hypothetical protein
MPHVALLLPIAGLALDRCRPSTIPRTATYWPNATGMGDDRRAGVSQRLANFFSRTSWINRGSITLPLV